MRFPPGNSLPILTLLGIITCGTLSTPTAAQTPNLIPVPPAPSPTIPTPSPLPPPTELLQPTPPNLAPVETLPDGTGTITVKRFEVVGNTVFSQEALDQVLTPFVNRPLTFAELLQARSAITQLYLENGYITSGALIPPQTLTSGIVTIQVIEGGLETINVSGTRRLNSNYIRSRLEVATAAPLNQKRLLEALQLLQLNPLIENVSAELQAGSQPGFNLLEVKVREADSFNIRLFTDNTRSPSVGSFRRGVEISEANLWGLGDSISAAYSNTDGSNAFDFAYTLPINPHNGTIGLKFSLLDSKVIEQPFDKLDIEASSRTYELTYRQPLLEKPTQEFVWGISATRRESDTSLLGIDFPLSPGADDAGRTRLTAVRTFQEYTQRGAEQVFAARSQFSLGFGDFAENPPSNPASPFWFWRGQVQWLRLLAPETLFLVRSDVQLTPHELVPMEQIGIGGLETVRGYRQDLLLTDNGLSASAELRYPILRTGDHKGVLHLIPFVDFGTGWNHGERPDPDPQTILSVGLGLRFQYSDRLTARFDWGIPLIDVQSSEKTWQENGLYFSLEWNLF